MGCCGGRQKEHDDLAYLKPEQKWDYINLSDFKSASCFAPFSYGILYISVIISLAVYGVDTFTAINLLAFSRWASQIKPKIPFKVSKWIFAGCIILSFVLLVYRWIRAIRVIKSGSVAKSYLDPIAVRIQSIRMGSEGQGFRRFLVFAELTKSKKGADYVALFTYFNFEAWLRIIFAEGPRQVVNGITLYSVMQVNLIPTGEHAPHDGTSPIIQFFNNIQSLAQKDRLQATILFSMLFTFVIWVLSILSLASSAILYVLFLWHHIPSKDGSLRAYCRRKIDTRLERIVKRKVNKALAKGLALQDRKRADLETGSDSIKRQPTLPTLDYVNTTSTSDLQSTRGLSRQTSTTTSYSRGPPSSASGQLGLNREPTLPDMNWENRSRVMGTPAPSTRIPDDTASLVNNAGGFAYTAPTLPPIERYGTPLSVATDFRPPTANSRRTPGPPTVDSFGRRTPGIQTPASADSYNFGGPPSSAVTMPDRTMTAPIPEATSAPGSYRNFTRPWVGPMAAQPPRQSPVSQYPEAPPSAQRAGTAPPYQDSMSYNQRSRF
ncbi:Potassium transporter [Emydomyces testavorans]|uniref:Potassium transporter n=1 Tax=Emydomyces testavorans TaxID=2070801 RepID=A0AAF0DH59_9EURO|nr:Potassium transporter [Emydomyces testavorans]